MTLIIVLGTGKPVTIGQYVAGLKMAKAHPHQSFTQSLRGRESATGQEIMHQFYADMVTDHCNRGAVILTDKRGATGRLLKRIKAGRVTRACAWCGATFTPTTIHARCCSGQCHRDLYY